MFFRLQPRGRLGYRGRVDGHPELLREIQREIGESRDGRITFVRFMELALYHERYGYYTEPTSARGGRIGKKGDYFTSVSVGPLFGKLLAKQFVKFREELGNPAEFEVVEFGGHRGQLRADVLAAAPDLRYRIIETGNPLPDSIVGCVFSNEFLDALPVHLVQVKDGAWQEVYVRTASPSPQPSPSRGERATSGSPLPSGGEDKGEGVSFEEVLGPLSTPRLADYLRDLPAKHMEGYRTEVNLRALDWLADVARRLRRGWIVTIDYGYERHEYFAPHHRDGTLLCYHHHTKSANPYANIGEQDITAHVEFTSLIELGKKLGLEPVTFTDQAHYLLQIGESEISEIVERAAGQPSKDRAAIHQLIHPELMGRVFRVLVQRKA
ncbi:MAG TPA: SAM-dependent methyltransferase [Verrucomicrobiae bacterium]|nr:SAM-dependent methyltransferase [Verrucomicrobiae bacterium]